MKTPQFRKLEEARGDVLRRTPSGHTCESGCRWCCHMAVPVHEYEASRIVRLLDHMDGGPEMIQAARDRAPLELERWKRLKNEFYWRLSPFPCVLLASDGTCSVYSERPLACRQLVSTGHPLHCRGWWMGGSQHPPGRLVMVPSAWGGGHVHHLLAQALVRAADRVGT